MRRVPRLLSNATKKIIHKGPRQTLPMSSPPLLSIQNLSVDFLSESGTVKAVKNISLNVHKGEIVAIVGESGSGKSVTSLSVLQLLPKPPAHYPGGKIIFAEAEQSTDLLKLSQKELQRIRGAKIAMIFQ